MYPTPGNASAVTNGAMRDGFGQQRQGADGDLLAPSPEPVAPSKRIDGIDVLRGLALSGVLMSTSCSSFVFPSSSSFFPP